MTFLTMTVTTKTPNVDAAVDAVVDAVLDDVVTEARESLLRQPKTGRVYRTKRGTHQASAPGQPPANWYGGLFSSIASYRTPDGGLIVASSEYAGFLEHGTSHIAPRPFMGPAARYAMGKHIKYETMFAMRLEAGG
jgi:hypothetical protein